jgi:hypothetical protein
MKNEIIYWTMKNGQKINIMEMDINHLRNVLKMIVKNSNKHKIQQKQSDIDHHEFESDLGFDFNNSEKSMEIGNNELGHY